MTDDRLNQITDILMKALGDVACTVYLFGSRADGTALPGSDYDIVVMADRNIERELARARFSLEESNIPFNVDLVDLSFTDSDFRDAVRHNGVILWKNSNDVSATATGH